MELEEYFGRKHYNEGDHPRNHYHAEDEYYEPRYSSSQGNKEILFRVFERIRNSRKIKLLVLLVAFLILTVIIALIIILIPLLSKIINYLTQNGLQGIIDKIISFIDTILKGSSSGSAIFLK